MGGAVTRQSAGLVVHRTRNGMLEVFLVHPGGPLWRNKDAGAWSIPKGEFVDGEDALAAACREFEEETGARIEGSFVALAPIRQRGGKLVHAWAVEGDLAIEGLASNTFTMEWPPRSGRMQIVSRGGPLRLVRARRGAREDQRSAACAARRARLGSEISATRPAPARSPLRAGRTSRATSRPSCSNTSVGQSLTR